MADSMKVDINDLMKLYNPDGSPVGGNTGETAAAPTDSAMPPAGIAAPSAPTDAPYKIPTVSPDQSPSAFGPMLSGYAGSTLPNAPSTGPVIPPTLAQAVSQSTPSAQGPGGQTPPISQHSAPSTDVAATIQRILQGGSQDELKAAQAQQSQGMQNAQLARGIEGIAGGIAKLGGVNLTPNEALLKGMEQQAQTPVSNLAVQASFRNKELDNGKTALQLKAELQSDQTMNDPNSLISQVSRAAAKKLGYNDIPDDATAQSLDKVLGLGKSLMSNALGWAKFANEQQEFGTKTDQANQRIALTSDALKNRIGQADTNLFNKTVQKALPELASKRTAFGIAAGKVQAAQALDTLLGQYPDLNQVPTMQLPEIARAVDNLITGSGQSSLMMTEHLTPSALAADVSKALSYYTGKPLGSNVGDMLKVYKTTANREAAVAKDQAIKTEKSVLAPIIDFPSRSPEHAALWDSWVQANPDLPMDEYGSQAITQKYNALKTAAKEGKAPPPVAPSAATPSNGGYPKQVTKVDAQGTHQATVSNAQEEKEAASAGFK